MTPFMDNLFVMKSRSPAKKSSFLAKRRAEKDLNKSMTLSTDLSFDQGSLLNASMEYLSTDFIDLKSEMKEKTGETVVQSTIIEEDEAKKQTVVETTAPLEEPKPLEHEFNQEVIVTVEPVKEVKFQPPSEEVKLEVKKAATNPIFAALNKSISQKEIPVANTQKTDLDVSIEQPKKSGISTAVILLPIITAIAAGAFFYLKSKKRS